MKVAGLDLGTNTFLMLVADLKNGVIENVIRDEIEVTRLGQEVGKTGRLHVDALLRADACLGRYRKIMDELGVKDCVAVATSAARDAQNKEDLRQIAIKHKIPIRIISGDKESQVTFFGTLFDRPQTDGVGVLDIGGGSSEITLGTGNNIEGHSFDIGSVRLTEAFFSNHPVPASEIEKIDKYIAETLNKGPAFLQEVKCRELVAVAGTPTTLAAVHQAKPYKESQIEGYVLKFHDIEMWRTRLAEMSIPERQMLTGMDPQRADVIVAGLSILKGFMEFLNLQQITVSDRGVRYGVVLNFKEIMEAPAL